MHFRKKCQCEQYNNKYSFLLHMMDKKTLTMLLVIRADVAFGAPLQAFDLGVGGGGGTCLYA